MSRRIKNVIAERITAHGGVESFLQLQHDKSILRFLTCGIVGDGKSTLIGRLFYDTRQIYKERLISLHSYNRFYLHSR